MRSCLNAGTQFAVTMHRARQLSIQSRSACPSGRLRARGRQQQRIRLSASAPRPAVASRRRPLLAADRSSRSQATGLRSAACHAALTAEQRTRVRGQQRRQRVWWWHQQAAKPSRAHVGGAHLHPARPAGALPPRPRGACLLRRGGTLAAAERRARGPSSGEGMTPSIRTLCPGRRHGVLTERALRRLSCGRAPPSQHAVRRHGGRSTAELAAGPAQHRSGGAGAPSCVPLFCRRPHA
jgi:hypothetical protein